MQAVISLVILMGLLGSPLGCMAACPVAQPSQDCCPPPAGITKCPLDILSSAKAVQAPPKFAIAAPAAATQHIVPVAESAPPPVAGSFAANRRDLHLQNRILRI